VSNQKANHQQSFSHSTKHLQVQLQPKEDLSTYLVTQVTTFSSPIAKQLGVTRPMLFTWSCGSWDSPAGKYEHTC
jgi:hypothetical protein